MTSWWRVVYYHPILNRQFFVYKKIEDLGGSVQLMQSLGWICEDVLPIQPRKSYAQVDFVLRNFKIFS